MVKYSFQYQIKYFIHITLDLSENYSQKLRRTIGYYVSSLHHKIAKALSVKRILCTNIVYTPVFFTSAVLLDLNLLFQGLAISCACINYFHELLPFFLLPLVLIGASFFFRFSPDQSASSSSSSSAPK